MAKPNIQLLKRLRTRFLRMRHKEHFQMGVVAVKNECGTAMCIAGHALDLAGYKFRFNEYGFQKELLTPGGRTAKNDSLVIARRLLRLDYGTAQALFHDYSLNTPKQAAARIQELIESAK